MIGRALCARGLHRWRVAWTSLPDVTLIRCARCGVIR